MMRAGKAITRQEFLKRVGATLLGALLGHRTIASMKRTTLAQDPTLTPMAYLPLIQGLGSEPTLTPTVPPTPGTPRVVHAHAPSATRWDFSTGWYGDYVDQPTVDGMVNQGVMELTGTSTVADAWRALVPNYQSGDGVAIKVNFNNSPGWSPDCDGSGNVIDALPHPVRAVIAGLRAIGVPEADIWIYDAIRAIPSRFKSVITALCPNVCFYDGSHPLCPNSLEATFSSTDPSAWVTFSQGISSQRVTDVVVEAAHLIDMPIVKRHFYKGTTLSFKNHFGTIRSPQALHPYIDVDGGPPYSSSQNPLVDIYLNPNIGAKTRLILGDGLFGALDYNQAPRRWSTFGDQAPNSLLFATDPVAVDCVMYDLLDAERAITLPGADDYLKVAQAAGLGTFEHCSSPGVYSDIDYVRIEL
jgi:hypothetical protein